MNRSKEMVSSRHIRLLFVDTRSSAHILSDTDAARSLPLLLPNLSDNAHDRQHQTSFAWGRAPLLPTSTQLQPDLVDGSPERRMRIQASQAINGLAQDVQMRAPLDLLQLAGALSHVPACMCESERRLLSSATLPAVTKPAGDVSGRHAPCKLDKRP